MRGSALIAVVAALSLGATSLATAKTRGAASAHSKRLQPEITSKRLQPDITGTAPRPSVADPYYRLSDSYYGYSDPYRGLFNVYAVPPYSPGNAYGYVRPIGR